MAVKKAGAIVAGSTYLIINKKSGKALSAESSAENGGVVEQFLVTRSDNQLWVIEEVTRKPKASAKAGLYLPIEEVRQTSDKVMRVQTLQPDVKNKYIKFNRRHKRLLEQLTQFPMGAHDDGPDALEGARSIAKKVKRFRILDRAEFGI